MLGHRRIFIPINSILTDNCSLHLALGSLWPFVRGAKGPGKVCVPPDKPDGNVGRSSTLAETFVSLKGSPPGHLLT